NVKDEILRFADDNVLLLDDSTTLLPPRILYQQSVADTRLIGVQLANVITFLKEKLGVDLKKVHVIGHSLGAHTAGYAGELVRGIGRITGLDPAGPYFRNVPRNVQLDSTDALFVDVIHSNPSPNILLGLGTTEDGGHIDFWPNGGIQLGCGLTLLRVLFNEAFPTSLQTSFNCRHQRSFEFFVYSFNQRGCLFVGVECASWSDFTQGKCNCGADGTKCALMGIFSTPKPPPKRRYYLKVAFERPYCHQVNTFLLTSFQQVGKIHSVEISEFSSNNDPNKAVIKAIEVNYLHPEVRKLSENKYCRPSSIQEPNMKKNLEFSSIHCHNYQEYSQ
ncbi:unnamed protein product, partial [Larinioides sclopetarius]